MTKAQSRAIKYMGRAERIAFEAKRAVIVVALVYLVVSAVFTGVSAYQYVNSHSFEWRSPILFQVPLVIHELNFVSQINVPKKTRFPISSYTEKQIVMRSKYGQVLWKIYGLETTWGKNDYCRNKGLGYGGFGVLADRAIVCYPTFEKAVERAQYWLTKNWDSVSLARTLCQWNTGTASSDCPYYQSYLSL